MNERLKELYLQAHSIRHYDGDPALDGNPPTVYWQGEVSAQRFAELIVRECAKAANDWSKDADSLHWDPWGAGYEAGYEAGVARRPAQPVQDHFPDATKMVQDADLWSAGYAAGYAAGMEECPAEPVQEPVAFAHINGTSDTKYHPPQRKSLTEEEILSVLRLAPPEPSLWPHLKDEAVVGDVQKAVLAIARAIERAHGIGE